MIGQILSGLTPSRSRGERKGLVQSDRYIGDRRVDGARASCVYTDAVKVFYSSERERFSCDLMFLSDRKAKERRVGEWRVHASLVYHDPDCVG